MFTCLLVKSSPRAQVEPLREHQLWVAPCSYLVDSHAHFQLGAAQLVCSQHFEGLPELLTNFHSIYFIRDLVPTSVEDPDTEPDPDPHFLGLLNPDPYPLVRGTDPDPGPSLFS
jgi:hypothetical protein